MAKCCEHELWNQALSAYSSHHRHGKIARSVSYHLLAVRIKGKLGVLCSVDLTPSTQECRCCRIAGLPHSALLLHSLSCRLDSEWFRRVLWFLQSWLCALLRTCEDLLRMRAVALTGLPLKSIPHGFMTLESGPFRFLWKPGFFVLSRLEDCPREAQTLCTRTVRLVSDSICRD